jgi:hypothetical protein
VALAVEQYYLYVNVRTLPESVVGDDKSLIVNNNFGFEASLTAVPVFSLSDSLVFLLESLDCQIREADPRRAQHTAAFSQCEIQASNRQRVCRRTPLQVDINAAVENWQVLSILIPETIFVS